MARETSTPPLNDGLTKVAVYSTSAFMTANTVLEAGDLDGSAVWKRVLRAIKEIWREMRREGEAMN